jgi:glycosyltransferase involved in cell wall biosynthesis
MKRVCYVFPVSHHYRRPFHEKLRELLAGHDVDYRVFYCAPGEENLRKNDTVDIPWGFQVPLTRWHGLEYQHALKVVRDYDLVVVQQENKLVLNYILNIASVLGLRKVAYFGHGRNFQSHKPDGMPERFKRFWATKVNWWFGYTDETRRHIETLGFPPEKITVFNNSVDTSELRRIVNSVTDERLESLRAELGLTGRHVGVFVGGVYPDKRMPFLVEAADRIRARLPDFELLVVGGGSDLPVISQLAESRPWIRVLGPRFGEEKVALMMVGHVFMMPGLMGLAILDAGAAGLPIATTAFPWHSPEIAYLEPGHNGLMVADWESPEAYGAAVADLLADPARRRAMGGAARDMATRFSIEAMAGNFAEGVLKALAS